MSDSHYFILNVSNFKPFVNQKYINSSSNLKIQNNTVRPKVMRQNYSSERLNWSISHIDYYGKVTVDFGWKLNKNVNVSYFNLTNT